LFSDLSVGCIRSFFLWGAVAFAEAVFEDCSLKGGIRMTLLPFAILGLCFYTITYPLVVFAILYRYRDRVMEDQLLRAEDRGGNRLENPNCYDIRKMYHK
jgi:hypothetical protein